MSKWTEKIPSFVWILIIVGGIAAFIGGIMGFFYAVNFIEGVGSIILLLAAWGSLRVGANSPDLESSQVGLAVLIVFFAMMGIALDQVGNFIYNQPMEWIFCPSGTDLARDTISRAARGGGVALSQNFSCVAESGEIIRRIGNWEHIFFRFFEYVLLGYILLGLSRLYTRVKVAVREKEK